MKHLVLIALLSNITLFAQDQETITGKYIAIESHVIRDSIDQHYGSSDSYTFDGFIIQPILLKNNHYGIEFTAVSQVYLNNTSFTIKSTGLSKPHMRRSAIQGLSFTSPQMSKGFKKNNLEFFNGSPEYSLSYISRPELFFIINNAPYLVLSGAQVNTGIPIDFSDYNYDENGQLVTEYFTFKLEGFIPCRDTSAQNNEIILCRGYTRLTQKIIPSSQNDTTRRIEVPLSTLSSPCPPRWYPGQ